MALVQCGQVVFRQGRAIWMIMSMGGGLQGEEAVGTGTSLAYLPLNFCDTKN